MKITNTVDYSARVSKLPSGRSVHVPNFAKVRAYKTPCGRRMALSDVCEHVCLLPGGGYKVGTVLAAMNGAE